MSKGNSYRNMLKEVERAVMLIEEVEREYNRINEKLINDWDNMSDIEKEVTKAQHVLLQHLYGIA